MPTGSKAYRALRSVATAWTRVDASMQRVAGAGRHALGGFLAEALDREEQSAIGSALYEARRVTERGLETWEQRWFAEHLPRAPADILVGGAGRGREAVELLRRGYRVSAFDPWPEGLDECRARMGPESLVVCARYEDLAAASIDDRPDSPAGELVSRTYDAVLLGWGSLGHVLDPEERRRLVITLDRLAPRGPILASFLSREDSGPEPEGRMARAGRSAGRALARWRGTRPAPDAVFGSHFGFVQLLARAELEQLAASVGRELEWRSGVYAHVTWWPRARGGYSVPPHA